MTHVELLQVFKEVNYSSTMSIDLQTSTCKPTRHRHGYRQKRTHCGISVLHGTTSPSKIIVFSRILRASDSLSIIILSPELPIGTPVLGRSCTGIRCPSFDRVLLFRCRIAETPIRHSSTARLGAGDSRPQVVFWSSASSREFNNVHSNRMSAKFLVPPTSESPVSDFAVQFNIGALQEAPNVFHVCGNPGLNGTFHDTVLGTVGGQPRPPVRISEAPAPDMESYRQCSIRGTHDGLPAPVAPSVHWNSASTRTADTLGAPKFAVSPRNKTWPGKCLHVLPLAWGPKVHARN